MGNSGPKCQNSSQNPKGFKTRAPKLWNAKNEGNLYSYFDICRYFFISLRICSYYFMLFKRNILISKSWNWYYCLSHDVLLKRCNGRKQFLLFWNTVFSLLHLTTNHLEKNESTPILSTAYIISTSNYYRFPLLFAIDTFRQFGPRILNLQIKSPFLTRKLSFRTISSNANKRICRYKSRRITRATCN